MDSPSGDPQQEAPAAPPAAPDLAARVAELEARVEALQDQVYRESERRDRELAEVRHALRPEELVRTLSEDARRRGL